MSLRLGDVLVQQGVLSGAQRDQILAEQALGGRPFGVLAERMFGVSPGAVERAWAEQYASLAGEIDPRVERTETYALSLINRRQAWQFAVMPVRFEGEELLICTTKEHLPRALKFAGWRLGHRCHFVVCQPGPLAEALARHYPLAGMDAQALECPPARAAS